MSFLFKPALYRGGELYELPRPVTVLRVQETWDTERFKVPLRNGDRVVGHSRNGIDFTVQGEIGSQAGSLKLSEQEMFESLTQLRERLHLGPGSDERYWLFLYCDATSGTYRHFRDCSTVRLDYDLSNGHLFSYSAVIHAEDPALYTTGPAAE